MNRVPVVLSFSASPISLTAWSGSDSFDMQPGSQAQPCQCDITPSPPPFPSNNSPSIGINIVDQAGNSYQSSIQTTIAGTNQVDVQLTIQPPNGGFTQTKLTVTVTLTYTGK